MREIEVKAKISDPKIIEARLLALGAKFSEPVMQEDSVYLQKGTAFEGITVDTPVLRIRVQTPGEVLLTYKHIRGEELDKQEHEVEISDAGEMRQILLLSGFYQVMAFAKRRRKCKLGEYEICLDKVEGLGDYVEIEKLLSDSAAAEDGQAVQKELFDFLRQLGVSDADKALSGYDVLIYNRVNSKSQITNPK